MNNDPTPPNTPGISAGSDPESMTHIDDGLRSLAADLDRLGAADRAGAGLDLEDRLMQVSLGALHEVQPTEAQAAGLGAMDRAAAPGDLEEGVFAESVPALREGANAQTPVLRHTGRTDRPDRRHVRVVRRVWWSNQYARLAAVVALVAGVGIMVRTSFTTSSPPTDIKGDMELLFAAMESKPSANTSPEEPASDQETDDLTKWLVEGATS
jgi:hypothetical protein